MRFCVINICLYTTFAFSILFGQSGDTLNRLDDFERRQGYWIIYGKDKQNTTCYKPEQKIEEGSYVNNKKNGVWKEYFCNGNFKNTLTFANGRPDGYAKMFYENGNLKEEGTWKINKWVGARVDTFKENRARNEIKINEDLNVTEAVLEWASNGMDADSSTHIDWYAKDVLEAYAMWQFKEHNRTYSAGEAENERQKYIQQVLIYRAEKSDLTINKLKRLCQGNAIAVKY